jgi:hypothetical protein
MPSGIGLPSGYERLREDCERFLSDNKDRDRNVFIMMRFGDGDPMQAQIDEELRKALCRHGLVGLRADDKTYATDNQLWTNVCIYMLCCKYGVAVLENRETDEFNANVAMEYGFMCALGKRTLLLADRSFHKRIADIGGTVYAKFDIADLAGTLAKTIEKWIVSLDVDVKAGPHPLQRTAREAHRRLLKIRCSEQMHDKTARAKEEDDEFHYFGEEIEAYRTLLRQYPNADHQAAVEDAYQRIALRHDFAAIAELADRFAKLAR